MNALQVASMFYFYFFKDLLLFPCICICAYTMYFLWEPEEGAEFSRTGAGRSCELLDLGAENQLWSLEEQLVLLVAVVLV